jgi:TRAP-type C4-dicarboxylate transport system permease small subunit
MVNLLLAIERRTSGLALALAILCLITAAGLAFYQVMTRFVLGQPSTWSEVLTRSAMIWCVFLGLAPTIRRGAMIAVEVVPNRFAGRARKAILLVGIALSMLFFAIVAWQGTLMVGRVARQNLAALDVSIGWVYAALPAGSAFALIALLALGVRVAIDRPVEPAPEARP